jgi:hypothetical protein
LENEIIKFKIVDLEMNCEQLFAKTKSKDTETDISILSFKASPEILSALINDSIVSLKKPHDMELDYIISQYEEK